MQNLDNNIWARQRTYRLSLTVKHWLIYCSGVLMCIVLGLITLTVVKQHTVAQLARYQQQLTSEVAELDQLTSQKQQFEQEAQQLDQKLAKVKKIQCTCKNNPHPYLKKIEKIIPDQVALQTFSFTTKNIQLTGIAPTLRDVTIFMSALAKLPNVAAPKLTVLHREKKQKIVQFTINSART
jgi:Tfp pilus assembly protein PilN